jgi:hypothetical protein
LFRGIDGQIPDAVRKLDLSGCPPWSSLQTQNLVHQDEATSLQQRLELPVIGLLTQVVTLATLEDLRGILTSYEQVLSRIDESF